MARLIALLLFCIYLLTYSGRLHSADELSALAVTESLFSGRAPESNLMLWAQYGQAYAAGVQGHFGPSGDLYSKRGIAHSLLPAPLFALGGLFPALGRVHLALLTTAAAAALTGALVHLTGRRLGYAPAPSALAALAFGLATPAWPYARSLLGEPFVGLGLALAMYGVVRARGDGPLRWPALAGIGLGLAAGVNLGNVAVAPAAIWALWRNRRRGAYLIAFGIPLAAALALIGAYNLARFGSPLDSGRDPALAEGFTAPLAVSVPALIFSPARGVLWFNPLVWLALAAAAEALRRREPHFLRIAKAVCGRGGSQTRPYSTLSVPERQIERGAGSAGMAYGWFIAAVAVIDLFVYGAWYMWWGGYSWGPRFLAPLAPLVALGALPALARACESAGAWRTGAALVLALAVGVQVLGVAVPAGVYEVELTQRFGFDARPPVEYQYGVDVLYDWSLAPILGHARLLMERGVSDVAWFAPGGVDWAAVIPLGAFAALLAGLLVRAARRRAPGSWPVAAVMAAMVALTAWAMVRNAARPLDPAHKRQPALDAIAEAAAPGDGVWVFFPEFTRSILNNYPAFPPTWGMPPLTPPDLQLETALATAQRRCERLWVLSWFDALDPNAWAEARLAAAHYALPPRRQVDGLWVARYAMRRGEERWQPAGWTFNEGLRLAEVAAAPALPEPGGVVRIALRWQATRDLAADYVIFVHLIDQAGALIASADHAPQNGFRPTWGWEAGESVIDRAALVIPESLARGELYTVRVGLYDWRAPEARLVGETAGGEEIDALDVLQFRLP